MRKRKFFKHPATQRCVLESNKDYEALEYERDQGDDLVSEIRRRSEQGKDFSISPEWD